MRPLLHAQLVNDRFGDPAVYVETLFERHAVLLDLGDISALPPRKANRIEQVFVSHAHIDHFFGFDFLVCTENPIRSARFPVVKYVLAAR